MKKQVKKVVAKSSGLFHGKIPRQRNRKPPGQAPGTIVYTGQKKLENVILKVHDFDEAHFKSITIENLDDVEPYLASESKTWIQVQGLHDVESLQKIWDYFELHPLIREDIVNTTQRAKVEDYTNQIFVVMRMISQESVENGLPHIRNEQLSIVLGENYVLSFQESDSEIFAPVLKRIETPNTRLRQFGPDYLAYALIDNIVDHYFHALDDVAEAIELLEDRIIENPESSLLNSIHLLRRDLIFFRKAVWPLRDSINSLIRDENTLIKQETKIYIRDVYDHLIQVIDSTENYREMIYSLYDMHMSGLSNKMNEVMKVLTIIATIFIPLTFVAGIYGMNFNTDLSPLNMPELNWYYGYPASLAVMILMALLMIYYFKRKSWF
jgi:magnesium transporter